VDKAVFPFSNPKVFVHSNEDIFLMNIKRKYNKPRVIMALFCNEFGFRAPNRTENTLSGARQVHFEDIFHGATSCGEVKMMKGQPSHN